MEGTALGLLLKKKEEEERKMRDTVSIDFEPNYDNKHSNIETRINDPFPEFRTRINDISARQNALYNVTMNNDEKLSSIYQWVVNNMIKLDSVIYTFEDGIREEILRLQKSIEELSFFQRIIQWRRVRAIYIEIRVLQDILIIYGKHSYHN